MYLSVSLLPVISSLGGTGAGRLRLIDTLDCFSFVSPSSFFSDSEFWTLGGLAGGTFRRGGLVGTSSILFLSGAAGCSVSITLAVTVTRGGLTGVLPAGVAGLLVGSSLAFFRGSLKNRPLGVRLDLGSFTDGKTLPASTDLS